ncbi:MAG: SprT-like domain-containing protein [Clostridiales bacterium]|nr:SprT-like domain-containing protein [Clostridiales bacterium]
MSTLFDYCNTNLFHGELNKPVITVQQDPRNKACGWFTVNKVWHERGENGGHAYELNMPAQELNRPITEIASTLIHEMCHLYAAQNNIQDTSRSCTYHNKMFKKIAEKHGLNVECVKTIGWSRTSLTADTKAMIDGFVKEFPDELIYRSPVEKGQAVKTSSTRKYECPCCGMSVRATKEVNIKCADCDVLMVAD